MQLTWTLEPIHDEAERGNVCHCCCEVVPNNYNRSTVVRIYTVDEHGIYAEHIYRNYQSEFDYCIACWFECIPESSMESGTYKPTDFCTK